MSADKIVLAIIKWIPASAVIECDIVEKKTIRDQTVVNNLMTFKFTYLMIISQICHLDLLILWCPLP